MDGGIGWRGFGGDAVERAQPAGGSGRSPVGTATT